MNLTQKQLALLAKVSTPTISRFEQAERDLQLSSVLAILDVLGMTDKRMLIFNSPEFRYDRSRGSIDFWGQDGKKRIHCCISREALEDHYSNHDRLRPEAAFKKYRRDIEALARRKYLSGRLESDGSVLIRTQDIA